MEKKENYAIVREDGKYLVGTTYYGNEGVVYVRTKEQCKKEIEMYYKNKGYSVRKII